MNVDYSPDYPDYRLDGPKYTLWLHAPLMQHGEHRS